jgi:lipoprotein-anchoring transpeptidase ErfK/SrfK
MNTMNLGRTAIAAAMAALVAAQAFALNGDRQVQTQQNTPAVVAAQQVQPATAVKREIVVSLVDRELALVENGKVVKIYRVAVGKPTTPSPVGTFTIQRRVANPVYQHHGKIIPPGPGNPVGDRWMGLNIRGYGIHGTNVPSSVGKAASHGCIRLGKADIEDLFSRVRIGDSVEIVDTRNAETAPIFNDGPKPPAAQPPAQTAKVTPPAPAKSAPATAPGSGSLLDALARASVTAAANNVLIGAL